MLKWLMHRATRAFEHRWTYDAGYMHDLIEADPAAAWRFQRATALSRYRHAVPADALAAATIAAIRQEDCGPCTQLAVMMAERAGVDAAVLRAALTNDEEAMPEPVALAWRFARAALDHDARAEEYREEISRRWGSRAVVSLAFAILTGRMYPTMKYALGHGKACSRVVVGGESVTVGDTAAAPPLT